ncbi:MAG: hypothetical protein LYZ69_03525 [Nitrososphaerales archaeon]|nr:hypothetical protein [Nitrososphaerales archaeon]
MPVCDVCGREFATEDALAQHARDKHEGGSGKPVGAVPRKTGTGGKASRPRSLRRRNRHTVLIGAVAVAVVLGIGFYLLIAPSLAGPPFACTNGEWIHVHPYLQIAIQGSSVTIPAGAGSVQQGSCLEPIHTHDASGILHIELAQAEATKNFTLGDFFTIWKYTYGTVNFNGSSRPIVFNSTDILGYKTDATHQVVLLVDGRSSTAWGSLNLEQLDYCSVNTTGPPCSPTAVGDPTWNGGSSYPYGTGHTIEIEYVTKSG